MSSYQPITPAFAWAHPEFDSVGGKREKAVKMVSNPLMNRTPTIATQETTKKYTDINLSKNDDKVEFLSSTSNNSSLRQRRKPNNESAMVLPPTKSLTEGFLNSAIEKKDLKQTPNSEIVIWNATDSSREVPEKTIMDYWILIYGFSSVDQFKEIMRRFGAFGKITNQRSGRSNWVALHYESSLEVEKALCQKPCLLSDGSVIGVCRMNEDLRVSLDWNKSLDNGGDQGKSCLVAIEDEDLYLEDPRRRTKATSICERLLSILFGWEENNHWV